MISRWASRKRAGVPEACTLLLQKPIGGMMRKFSWIFLSFLLFIACDNSNLTKEQGEINQLSQELERVKNQLEEVISQIDKTNQELNRRCQYIGEFLLIDSR